MFGRLERSQGTEPMSAINVTPLVDVMLVLVVIFILTAPLLASSVKLELPKTDAASMTDATHSVSLVVDRAGQAYLDNRAVPLAELSQSLTRTAARQPDTEVQLRADENAPYGKVVEVLGVAQKAGLTRIGFVTDAPSAPTGSAKAASP
jgi:biopolymer transport protein TolR